MGIIRKVIKLIIKSVWKNKEEKYISEKQEGSNKRLLSSCIKSQIYGNICTQYMKAKKINGKIKISDIVSNALKCYVDLICLKVLLSGKYT